MSDFATIGEQAPSNRQQRRAPYRDALAGDERYANEMTTATQIVDQRDAALAADTRMDELQSEVRAAEREWAGAADALGDPGHEGRDMAALADQHLQAAIQKDIAAAKLSRLAAVIRAAEASGASHDEILAERLAAAADLARIHGLIRLWDRRLAEGGHAIVGTTLVVMAGGRDQPVDVHDMTPESVDPEDPPGSLVVASPAAPHGPPAPWVGVAA